MNRCLVNRSLVLAFIAYFTFYYNRKAVTLLFPQLIKEGLTQQNAGTIVSSQGLSMAFVTFVAGILSDKFAAKHLVCLGLFLSGISTLMFAGATDVKQFALFWFINGLGQGFSLPSLLKLTKDNSEATSFATNWSLVLISVNFAGVINPFLSALIAQHYHWTTGLLINAFITLFVASLCFLMLETKPKSDTKSSKSTKTHEKGINPENEMKTSELLKYPLLWMCIICRFAVALTRNSVTDWSQIYLINEQHIDVYMASTFISFVEIGGIFGKLTAGRLSDLLLKRAIRRDQKSSSSKIMARIPVSIAMLAMKAFALHLYCFHINRDSSVVMLTLTAILIGINTSGNVVNLSVIATELSPRKSGLCSSLVNLSAKIGAMFTGLPLSLIANQFSWNYAFVLIEMFCIFCVCLQLFVTRISNKTKID